MDENRPALTDPAACYAAFRSHDVRFDGRFFVGIVTTGIYCRPVCRVKMPKPENCAYYSSAAAAEAAGYRPCLKCRPELAPGLAPIDTASRLARQAALRMEEDCLADSGITQLAQEIGVSDRHLRRVFAVEYGVTPRQYLQTCRLLLAKSLLTDTTLPVTEVALAAGFGSIRSFNHLFRQHYRMTPASLRTRSRSSRCGQNIAVQLDYRPPYQWENLRDFLSVRAIPGVESVDEHGYCRTVSLLAGGRRYCGWLRVSPVPGRHALRISLPPSLLPVLAKVLARVKVLFDLDCDPAEIAVALSSLNELSPGMCIAGTRLPGCFDPFEMAVRAVLGQQITIKAARTLAARFAAAFGEKIVAPAPGLDYLFPEPEVICRLAGSAETRMGALGITRARSRTIVALAEALASGRILLAPGVDPAAVIAQLQTLPGIGAWTAQYLAMRALGWPDAFLHTDYGVKKALAGRTAGEMLALASAWRPWRSYAVIQLWQSLKGGTT
ncbi:MAG: AlkA N-terminal domain-containing protein [Sporomusaceae bacterium]|nr:AlkA N-terminal domain-containing protein [Sporomusaceae bacterium]